MNRRFYQRGGDDAPGFLRALAWQVRMTIIGAIAMTVSVAVLAPFMGIDCAKPAFAIACLVCVGVVCIDIWRS